MATPRSAGLDQVIMRYRQKQMRQMGIAIMGFTAVLLLVVLVAPKLMPAPAATVAVETPEAPKVDSYQGVSLIGKAAVVYDLATGEVLFERNAKAQLPLASLTKLLTMYAASDT
ncbi:MAG: hypothetical protein AAB883_02375, partial [Patescibacteria group bacterium]